MAENAKHSYDESKIKTLSSLDHIRLAKYSEPMISSDLLRYDQSRFAFLAPIFLFLNRWGESLRCEGSFLEARSRVSRIYCGETYSLVTEKTMKCGLDAQRF
jgi:hypothetical protein